VNKRAANLIEGALRYGLMAAIAAPLFGWHNPVFGIVMRPEIFFQMAVEISALLWIALILIDGSYQPKQSALVWAVLFWLIAWGASTVSAADLSKAIFSTRERLTGYFLMIHLAAFFLIAASVMNSAAGKRKLLEASVLTSLAVSLYGLGQFIQAADWRARIGSTLGNPSYLAAWLLFNLFFGVRLFGDETRRPAWRQIWLASVLINFAAFIFTASRAAYLGLYAGLIILAAIAALARPATGDSRGTTKKIAAAFLALAILAPTLFIFAARSGIIPQTGPISRLTNLSNIWVYGLRNRVIAWQIAWQAFKEKPVLGWGPEHFNNAFDKYFNPEIAAATGMPEAWFDRSHNALLDALAMGGLVGGTATLVLIIALFAASGRLLRSDKLAGAVFLAALAGYAAQSLFFFDTIGSYLPLFLLAAILAPETRSGLPAPPAGKFNFGKLFLMAAAVAGVGFLLVKFNALPLMAQGAARESNRFVVKDPAALENRLMLAFSYRTPYSRDIWLEFTNFIMGDAVDDSIKLEPALLRRYAEFSKKEFIALDLARGGDARIYYEAGKLGNLLGALGEPDPAFVEQNLSQALELSPKRLDIYYEIAQMYRLKGDHRAQFDWLKKALALHENVAFSWWNLGVAYADVKDYRSAVASLEKAIEKGYTRWQDPAIIQYLVAVYAAGNGPISRIVEFWEAGVRLQPQNAQFWASLAASYAAAGQKENARAAALKAVELDPNLKPEADAFLKSLSR